MVHGERKSKGNILQELKEAIWEAALKYGEEKSSNSSKDLGNSLSAVKLELVPPAFAGQADLATNVAMVLAKSLQTNPVDLAQAIGEKIEKNPYIEKFSVVKPGFLNIQLSPEFYIKGLRFGCGGNGEQHIPKVSEGEKVNVEYVSANPTGPLHIGHVRGAIYGDVIAALLKEVGFDVTKEYYINDGGGQIATLLKSAFLRYKQSIENLETIEIPESCYPGEYLVPVGEILAKKFGTLLLNEPENQVHEKIRPIVLAEMMKMIKNSMHSLGIRHDVFTSEQDIINKGYVEKAINLLRQKGLCYIGSLEKPKGIDSTNWISDSNQEIFKTTLFGDDVDRAIIRSDGSFSYFAPDIGYHYYKYERGFNKMILVVGADHKGYATRISAAVSAISDGEATIKVKLCELVNFIEDGQKMKSSKRSGKFLTADDIIKELGTDAIRFIILSRKNDTPLDFDLQIAKAKSKENPVFYTQYAYSRCCSLLRGFKEVFSSEFLYSSGTEGGIEISNWEGLKNKKVQRIILMCLTYTQVLSQAAKTLELHTLVTYLTELSGEFHGLWGASPQDGIKFIQKGDKATTEANMVFVLMVKNVISSCLSIIGVSAPDFM